ncbi:recombinase family protein [Nocardioides bizhenqiangii]|uniref:Recombinase family protein n=1 Tax=Nocardioides bizhenqiangii TaxID=3095076 RepID=A0ABZ0ZSF2_9ACTN|nr:recombinase family protein [Nocardioides sp. HM61]WQQ26824.1 recombinase family protein [Nocardioides sp. HM61]
MTAATYGYARVSTGQQTTDQQDDALRAAGCSKVFGDKLSGAKADRPGLAACLDQLRPGDTLVIVALDRLGRSTLQVLSTLQELHQRGVIVKSLRESLDFSTPLGQAVATIMSALAEMELALIRERAAAAREAARARGKQTGRPRVLDASAAALARRMRANGEPIAVIAKTLGVSRASVYRYTEAITP